MKSQELVPRISQLQISRGLTFPDLVQRVKEVLASGRARAEEAVDLERARTYWETGRWIHVYELKGEDRAKYGERLFENLAGKLGMARTLVQEMHSVYLDFPIRHARVELGWTQLRLLRQIRDSKKRFALAKQAAREDWTTREIKTAVREIQQKAFPSPHAGAGNKKGDRSPAWGGSAFGGKDPSPFFYSTSRPPKPLVPRRGEFYVYRILKARDLHKRETEIYGIHLGFDDKYFPALYGIARPREGGFIRAVRTKKNPAGDKYKFQYVKEPPQRFYATYKTFVTNVLDDDTLWGDVDLGFRMRPDKKLRLRGIDAAEIEKGKPASDFVRRTLAKVPFVVIVISGRDKFGRPLADLFYLEGTEDQEKVLQEGIFLNQQLLDLGLAQRVED